MTADNEKDDRAPPDDGLDVGTVPEVAHIHLGPHTVEEDEGIDYEYDPDGQKAIMSINLAMRTRRQVILN